MNACAVLCGCVMCILVYVMCEHVCIVWVLVHTTYEHVYSLCVCISVLHMCVVCGCTVCACALCVNVLCVHLFYVVHEHVLCCVDVSCVCLCVLGV